MCICLIVTIVYCVLPSFMVTQVSLLLCSLCVTGAWAAPPHTHGVEQKRNSEPGEVQITLLE